jgi:hypothetical protein
MASQRAQNLLRWLADDAAQFFARQRCVAVRQEYPKNRIYQRRVLADVTSLLATMNLQDMLQPVYLRHLTRLIVYPIDFLRIEVIAENRLVFLAKVGSQLDTDVQPLPFPPVIIDMKGCVKRGLD